MTVYIGLHFALSDATFGPESWVAAPCLNSSDGTYNKGVFTLVPSEDPTRTPCPAT